EVMGVGVDGEILVVGDAVFDCLDTVVRHPLLLQSVTLEHYTANDAFIIRATGDAPELYVTALSLTKGIDEAKLRALEAEVAAEVFTPTQDASVEAFISRVKECLPADVPNTSCQPGRVLLLRAGDIAALDERSILLSKEANEEQLRICRRHQRSSCVLVQGPPGTGKTHTIANLVGHLLAQGKSVLVTAQTSKALRVLRDMVVKPLRPLCISVLDNDADNRAMLNRSVEKIARRLGESDAGTLLSDAEKLRQHRAALLDEADRLRSAIFDARRAETTPLAVMGDFVPLMEAARTVTAHAEEHGWLPGPLTAAIRPPLSAAEFAELYQSNHTLTAQDEQDLSQPLPPVEKIVGTSELATLLAEQARSGANATLDRPELWVDQDSSLTAERLEPLLPRIRTAANLVREAKGWWVEVLRAGQLGGETRAVWEELAFQIEAAAAESDGAQRLLMAHGPEIAPPADPAEDDTAILGEIVAHLAGGSSLGIWTKTTKRLWHRCIDRTKVSGRAPETREEFEALHALSRLMKSRRALLVRWERQVSGIGGPAVSELGPQPERAALPFASEIRSLLSWYHEHAAGIERELQQLGFQWPTLLSAAGEQGELSRLRHAFAVDLEKAIRARRDAIRMKSVDHKMGTMVDALQHYATSPIAQRLLQALQNGDATTYADASRDLSRLTRLQPVCERRIELLQRLEKDATVLADLIRRRVAPHDQTLAPGDIMQAWAWRQMHDELQKRSALPLNQHQARLDDLHRELRDVTIELIDRKAWAAKKQRVGLQQQAALEGYVACLRKMTKSGRGRRDAALLNAAREHLATARQAVPVWIMPLSRVYESFFRRDGLARFDVVIIDEASQSDVSSLAALYLGAQAIIVGDEEQVTPTPFADLDRAQRLITQNLEGVPNRELYDPETSVYHLARAFFPDRILLKGSFRSVPEIVQFSNHLSYDLQIKPLRDTQSSPVKPALVAHRTKALISNGKVNTEEAEDIASLLMATMEMPEYELNDLGEPTTYGVISLAGDEQASYIEKLLRARISPADFERRRIVCGNASQFQGDERDVIFVTLVDGAAGDGNPLPLREFGPKEIFRKRYNVAVSRARNQLWVVHSLDPMLDLQPADLRRRLIEHALNPASLMKDLEQAHDLATSPMQREIHQWLTQRGYAVTVNWPVGAYRIPIVVKGGRVRLGIECDGERALHDEDVRRDMERQETLERLGWRFVRVRGSVFARDVEAAMRPIQEALVRLGIQPEPPKTGAARGTVAPDLLDRVRRRASEVRWMWQQRTQKRAAEAKTEVAVPVVQAPVLAAKPVPVPAEGGLPPLPTPEVVVEVGDWIEFILVDAPNDPQLVNIISGPTDVDQSAFNISEPLAIALLGREKGKRGRIDLGDGNSRELEVRQIHKPHKQRKK
ncbi:MAG: AAA domain-containing protein, partial [Roseimicrobium sp.]